DRGVSARDLDPRRHDPLAEADVGELKRLELVRGSEPSRDLARKTQARLGAEPQLLEALDDLGRSKLERELGCDDIARVLNHLRQREEFEPLVALGLADRAPLHRKRSLLAVEAV